MRNPVIWTRSDGLLDRIEGKISKTVCLLHYDRKVAFFCGPLSTRRQIRWASQWLAELHRPLLFCSSVWVCVRLPGSGFRRCTAQQRRKVWGRTCCDGWAQGESTASPGPTCTLWGPTRPGPEPAWRCSYWFAGATQKQTKRVLQSLEVSMKQPANIFSIKSI